MQHHAYVVEAETEAGIELALGVAERELGLTAHGNPDVVVLRHGLFSVEDARALVELASAAPFKGDKRALVVAADRAYHEAQNALLKLFEEPPEGLHLFLILPTLGGLVPTLRSRVQILRPDVRPPRSYIGAEAEEFIKGGKEARAKMIKKLTSGKDEDARRLNRDDAIAFVNGVERAVYHGVHAGHAGHAASGVETQKELLQALSTLRDYLYDRSAPVKQILEHLAIVTPSDLL